MKRVLELAVVGLLGGGVGLAQFRSDTSIIFTPSNPNLFATSGRYSLTTHAWGFDLSLSNNGFAAGMFLRREFTGNLAGTLSLSISDVKAEGEMDFFDSFGQSYVPGKANRLLLLPLFVSMQYRLFEDDITDSFRPFVSAGLGPCMVYVAPYSRTYVDTLSNNVIYSHTDLIEFFTSLKSGQPRYTLGGYIGAGAHFGLDRTTLTGLSVRYTFVPFPDGIEVLSNSLVRDVGGFYITLHFGSFY
jgi:hypothetical protein